MKIGIITYWRGTSNYGMLVQHWALQTALKNLGHKPFLIRYFPGFKHGRFKRWMKEYNLVEYARIAMALICGNINPLRKYIHDRRRNFAGFRNNNIEVSHHKYYSLNDLQNNPPLADAYLTGSDQVWSQLLSFKENETYFLNFGPKDVKRISYAPSFSMNKYPIELREQLSINLSHLDYISCREYSGVAICKSVGADAVKVLDPTFLLAKDDYLKLIAKDTKREMGDYIFIYSLNISDAEDIRWEELKHSVKNMKYVITPADGYIVGSELFSGAVRYSYCTLEEWLSNIYYSSLVVTPSFHGIALSIILEKDFVYVPLHGENAQGNDRVIDLLADMGLSHRILTSANRYSDIVSREIDWGKVKAQLFQQKEQSVDFLKKSLF